MKYPAVAEAKIDGEFNFLYYDKISGATRTVNKYGTTRRDFPALNDIHKILSERGIRNAVFLCELYWGDGKAGALYDLLSRKQDNDVQLGIFDILSIDDLNIDDRDLNTRKEVMFDLLNNTYSPRFTVVSDDSQAKDYFERACNRGWEGIVVKSLDSTLVLGPCAWVKMKKKDRSDWEVLLVDPDKERIEVLVVTVSGNKSSSVHVGVACCNRYKKHIKVGDMVTVEHQGVLPSGSLRHPVLIKQKGWT